MRGVLTDKQVSTVNVAARRALDLRSGDTVKVHQKIQEKGKTRIQIFEGLIIARKHGREAGGTFTVRAVTSGVGVEKIYPLYSPMIDKIEIVRRAKVRRAKLYHIRDKAAREVKRQLRTIRKISATTAVVAEEAVEPVVEEALEAPEVTEVEEETKKEEAA
jgi:large subunit ribosomal protein L19